MQNEPKVLERAKGESVFKVNLALTIETRNVRFVFESYKHIKMVHF